MKHHGTEVAAKVLAGGWKGVDPDKLIQDIYEIRWISTRPPVAYLYAHIGSHLRAQRILIPPHDLFIAATAVERDLVLITRNRRHFERIPDLKIYSS